MRGRTYLFWLAFVVFFALPLQADAPSAAVSVHHTQGTLHGFLALRTTDGQLLADGDVTQIVQGDRITNHVLFHFKDGSLQDEIVVYSQRHTFRLLSYHLIQKGSAFKRPMDVSIDGSKGQTTVRYTDDDGKEKETTDHMKIPPGLANGMIPILLTNISPDTPQTKLSMIVATPKPRVVGLTITPSGEDSFSIGNSARKAQNYAVKVEIGGVAGLVAPLVGKQPPDTHVWILEGEVPAFLRSEGPLFEGGPIWRIELTSPTWT